MTTFLFTAVAVSGMSIIAKGVPFTRRNRFILTAGLALGYGATLVPHYFSHVFDGYTGDDRALQGFLDAISLIMETGFAVTALVTVALNLGLPIEIEDEGVDGEEVRRGGNGTGAVREDGSSGRGSGLGGEEVKASKAA